MKIKIQTKKLKNVPDRLCRVLYRTWRHNRLVLLRTSQVKTAKRLVHMEAGCALRLFARFTHFQLSIRPRIRLVSAVILVLIFFLMATSNVSDFVRARESEIKINGQAILIADKAETKEPPSQIEAAISSKRSPFDFIRPAGGYISQGYYGYHRAIDITGDYGSAIKPLGAGRVEFAGFLADGHGNTVVIDHENGLKSLYSHMSKINVGVGNGVPSGSTIGSIGLTGHTTGPHVHVEVYDNGIAVDPAKLLPE